MDSSTLDNHVAGVQDDALVMAGLTKARNVLECPSSYFVCIQGTFLRTYIGSWFILYSVNECTDRRRARYWYHSLTSGGMLDNLHLVILARRSVSYAVEARITQIFSFKWSGTWAMSTIVHKSDAMVWTRYGQVEKVLALLVYQDWLALSRFWLNDSDYRLASTLSCADSQASSQSSSCIPITTLRTTLRSHIFSKSAISNRHLHINLGILEFSYFKGSSDTHRLFFANFICHSESRLGMYFSMSCSSSDFMSHWQLWDLPAS